MGGEEGINDDIGDDSWGVGGEWGGDFNGDWGEVENIGDEIYDDRGDVECDLGSTGGDKGEVAGNSLDLGVDVATGNLVTVAKIVYNNE